MRPQQYDQARHSGIDLIRIMAMLLITALHYIQYTGLLTNQSILPVNNILFSAIYTLSMAAVNLFGLLTGFLLSNKEFSLRRLTRVWVDVVCVSLVGLVVGIIAFGMPSKAIILKSVLPVTTFSYWYINTYVMLLCVSPLLNMLIKNVEERKHLLFCIVLTLFVSIFMTVNPFAEEMIYIGHGRGIVWFCVLYLWGAYFARSKAPNLKTVALIVGIAAWAAATVLMAWPRGRSIAGKLSLFENTSPFTIVIALSLFVLLKDIRIKTSWVSKILKTVAGSALFIYLIQEHNSIRTGLWQLLNPGSEPNSITVWCFFLISLVCMWPAALIFKAVCGWIWPLFDKIVNLVCCKLKSNSKEQL